MAFKIQFRRPKVRPQPAGVQNTFALDDDELSPEVSGQMMEEARTMKDQGQDFATAEQWQAALRCWDRALQLNPRDGSLYELQAQVFLELGLGWEAVQAASRATQMMPAAAVAFLTLARAQLCFGEPQMAVLSFQRVLQLQPDNLEAAAECTEAKVLAIQQQRNGGGVRVHVVSDAPAALANINVHRGYSPVHSMADNISDMDAEQTTC